VAIDPPETLSLSERILLTLDAGLLARVDHEVAILARASKERAAKVQGTRRLTLRRKRIAGHAVTRLEVLRELIRESLDRRATARGEAVPSVEVAGPFGFVPEGSAPEVEAPRSESAIVAALEAEAPASASDFEDPIEDRSGGYLLPDEPKVSEILDALGVPTPRIDRPSSVDDAPAPLRADVPRKAVDGGATANLRPIGLRPKK